MSMVVNVKDTTEGRWTVEEVVKKVTEGKIVLDIAIQRSECWTDSQKEALIDSIVEGLPKIPYIEANRTESGTIEALDGKQRLSTLRDILTDVFVVTREVPFKFNGKEYDLKGKHFSEFPQEIQQQISLYPLNFVIYEDLTEIEKRVIFYRRNLGKPLSKAELFRATCKSLAKVNELGHHPLFDSFTSEASKEEMVVKTKVMLDGTPHLSNDAEAATTWASINFDKSEEKRFVDLYDKTFRIYELYKEISAERIDFLCKKEEIETRKISSKQKTMAKKPLKKTHLLTLLPIIEKNMDYDNELFAIWLCKFFDNSLYVCSESTEYNSGNNGGMGSVSQTKLRLGAMQKSFNSFKKKELTKEQVIKSKVAKAILDEENKAKEKISERQDKNKEENKKEKTTTKQKVDSEQKVSTNKPKKEKELEEKEEEKINDKERALQSKSEGDAGVH